MPTILDRLERSLSRREMRLESKAESLLLKRLVMDRVPLRMTARLALTELLVLQAGLALQALRALRALRAPLARRGKRKSRTR